MLDDSAILPCLVILLGAAVFLLALTRYLRSRGFLDQPNLSYPPGPKGLPFIGNVLDLPRGMHMWEGFTQMAEAYRMSMALAFCCTHNLIPCVEAKVMYLNGFGTNIVVLSSSEAIADLLDKRSAVYSDKVTAFTTYLQSGSNTISFPVIAPINDSGTNGDR